jgi:prevent-host-death family protein
MMDKTISATHARIHFGEVIQEAQNGPVIVERDGVPKIVILSKQKYEELIRADATPGWHEMVHEAHYRVREDLASKDQPLSEWLEPEQHRSLAVIARSQNRSIVDLTQDIIDQYLVAVDEADRKQLDAFEQIKEHRADMLTTRGGKAIKIDVASIIQEMREERDDQLFTSLPSHRD